MKFLILPDNPAAEDVARDVALRESGDVIRHASGRPWIIGSWPKDDVVVAAAGRNRIAVLGCSSTTAAELGELAGKVHHLADLDRLLRRLSGNFHLVASVDGHVRAQGNLSTACQIFYADVDGITVAADRPQTLSALTGAGVDDEVVALTLLAPTRPWPLSERSSWLGVNSLPLGTYLRLHPDGDGQAVRWWEPPAPETPLAQAAERIQAGLLDAVIARTRGGGLVSADLSGGMDSTSLCFLAAAGGASLLTTRWVGEDAADDDRIWAERAAARLPQAEHVVIPRGEAPMWFADMTDPDGDIEGPFAWIRTRARVLALAREVAHRGSHRHFTGDGGDELFFLTPNYLHSLVRRHPLTAVRHAAGFQAISRVKTRRILRGLAETSSFGGWLAASAGSIDASLRGVSGQSIFQWGAALRMPPWATPQALETVRRSLRAAGAEDPVPLAPLRAQHGTLQDVRLCGDILRRVNRLTAGVGVQTHAPFLDDRVVEAALSVRFEERADPKRYKPALAAAMRGVVPDDILDRPTKAEFSAEAYAGLARHRQELLALCDDLHLARLGLVNAGALRSALVGLHTSSRALILLDGTLAAEMWLRSVAARTTTPVMEGIA